MNDFVIGKEHLHDLMKLRKNLPKSARGDGFDYITIESNMAYASNGFTLHILKHTLNPVDHSFSSFYVSGEDAANLEKLTSQGARDSVIEITKKGSFISFASVSDGWRYAIVEAIVSPEDRKDVHGIVYKLRKPRPASLEAYPVTIGTKGMKTALRSLIMEFRLKFTKHDMALEISGDAAPGEKYEIQSEMLFVMGREPEEAMEIRKELSEKPEQGNTATLFSLALHLVKAGNSMGENWTAKDIDRKINDAITNARLAAESEADE